jgi:undecaprenyl pyrophosphate phosphatase UppP
MIPAGILGVLFDDFIEAHLFSERVCIFQYVTFRSNVHGTPMQQQKQNLVE